MSFSSKSVALNSVMMTVAVMSDHSLPVLDMCVHTWQLYIESVLLLLPFRLLWRIFNPVCIAKKGHDTGLLVDLKLESSRLSCRSHQNLIKDGTLTRAGICHF